MGTFAFRIETTPIAQPRQRHRLVKHRGGKVSIQNFTPKSAPVTDFKRKVAWAIRDAYDGPPLEDPVQVDVTFVMPRPTRLIWKTRDMPRQWHTARPDRDNLEKSLYDALSGLLWVDDSQICAGKVEKVIAAGDERPHVDLLVKTLSKDSMFC